MEQEICAIIEPRFESPMCRPVRHIHGKESGHEQWFGEHTLRVTMVSLISMVDVTIARQDLRRAVG